MYDAVHRARRRRRHVVLASGRSPHGMTRDRRPARPAHDGADPLWIVASNGAVVFRYPPLEVVHEVTFDAAPAVQAVLEHHPTALVAVEERGVGYRVNRPFPPGELTGEMIDRAVDELVAGPVSRVIIRDPDATADDFVALAAAARAARHRLRRRLDGLARPRARWASQGLRARAGRRRLGVDAADVLAIGDGRNDIEMLQWAGRGVAMGQAVEVVREAADAVTGTVHDDGAAAELPTAGSRRRDRPS